jgi:hypothetical protein
MILAEDLGPDLPVIRVSLSSNSMNGAAKYLLLTTARLKGIYLLAVLFVLICISALHIFFQN